MLTHEENALLTQTGAGTPMGELMRRYWIPALLSEEIPTPDSPPVQVRILGEELVAFRDTMGRIGLIADHCLHRGTSLSYGRNEECGLRCVYHGWKFDVDGHVVDTPAEPTDSRFKEKLHHRAYPTREAAGVIFAYMGPTEDMPLFPNYLWTELPVEYTYVTKCLLECSYLQGLEGECDSAHLGFCHADLTPEGRLAPYAVDVAPLYEIEHTDFGLRFIATRHAGGNRSYVRVSSFIPPLACWVPARGKEVHLYVPLDDTHSWRYDLGFRTDRPVRPDEVHRRAQIQPDYTRIRTQRNHYLQDRVLQRTRTYTGIEDFLNHDACCTETMGAIYDRSKEHLGASDTAVIAARRLLLQSIRALQAGHPAPHRVFDPAQNHFEHVDTIAQTIEGDWRQAFPHLARGVLEVARA